MHYPIKTYNDNLYRIRLKTAGIPHIIALVKLTRREIDRHFTSRKMYRFDG